MERCSSRNTNCLLLPARGSGRCRRGWGRGSWSEEGQERAHRSAPDDRAEGRAHPERLAEIVGTPGAVEPGEGNAALLSMAELHPAKAATVDMAGQLGQPY